MASERDFELLDDYIGNRLAGADKEYIERKLEQDPDLRSEYAVQKQIAAGLRNARVAELKQMLNNIPVPPANGQFSGLAKVAGVVIVAVGSLSIGYYFWQSGTQRPTPGSSLTEQPAERAPSAEQERTSEIISDKTEPALEEPKITPAPASPGKDDNKPASAQKNTSRINVFDPTSDQESAADPVIPEANVSNGPQATMKASQMLVETNNTNKKYSFHYQVNDGKLILYGPFEENFYEILEFIASEKRTVFLYYRDSYYLLNTREEKITPLAAVNDPELLSKLRQYRTSVR